MLQIVNLLLQAYLFKRFLFQPVKKILMARREEVDGIYEDANRARAQAEEAKSAYDAKLQAAANEAEALVQKAAYTAKKRSEQLLLDTKAESSAIRERASAAIALEQKKARNELKNEISVIAVELAERITEQELNAARHKALIEEFMEGLGEDA